MRYLKIVFAVCLALFLVKLALYHYHLVIHPYPLQYREGAMMTSTEALVHGKNPFDYKLQPQYTNDYGIVYSLLVTPFAKVFGITMKLHRMVTAFFIFACCAMLFLIMHRLKVPTLLNAAVGIIFYASMLYPGTTTPSADPSSLGVFLFLSVIFVPWLRNYSWGSLLVSIGLGIIAYYTKPYFLVCVPLIASYIFFFVSKRKGLAYSGMFVFLAVLSTIVVNHLANCYFANCFFIHDNIRHLYMEHLISQLIQYARLHAWALVALVISLIGVFAFNMRIKIEEEQSSLKTSLVPVYIYGGLATGLLLVLWLGKHSGADMWYFFHLFSPFFLIGTAVAASRFVYWPCVIMPMLIINCWVITKGHDYRKMDHQNDQWRQVKEMIAANQHVLTTSLLTPMLIEQGREFDDSGLSEYSRMGGYRYNKMSEKFFPPDSNVIYQFYKYNDKVVDRVINHYFNIVIITRDYAPMVPEELTHYYQYIGDLDLPLPSQGSSYKVTVFKPKQ